jgi:hypothetical protein
VRHAAAAAAAAVRIGAAAACVVGLLAWECTVKTTLCTSSAYMPPWWAPRAHETREPACITPHRGVQKCGSWVWAAELLLHLQLRRLVT